MEKFLEVYFSNFINLCKSFPKDAFKGMIICNRDGRVIFSDMNHAAFFGRSQEEEIGSNIYDLNKCSVFHKAINNPKPIVGKAFKIRNKKFIGSLIQLKDENDVIGVMGLILPDNATLPHTTNLFLHNIGNSDIQIKAIKNGNTCFENIIGISDRLKKVKDLAYKASQFDFPVLIRGETGTGKSMFAKIIHAASSRSRYPFVQVNCASIPKDLFETELFGYEPGSFTGSSPKGKPGKFEIAHKGTIFLDEIGCLPLELQVKLLDILEEKQVVRIGGVAPKNIDFRMITATNENLTKMILEKSFRSELYFRINVINLDIPPLRERREDIPILIRHKVNKIIGKYSLENNFIKKDLIKDLNKYSFPGNVRELFNIIERTMFNEGTTGIDNEDIHFLKQKNITPNIPEPLKKMLNQMEKSAITQALKYTRGDVSDAAKILEIHRTTLYKKINKYEITFHHSTYSYEPSWQLMS